MSLGEEFDGIDLPALVYDATSQIPEGMVSTYGDIAKALGDVKASRAIGMILAQNPTPIVVPCHRVVYADGSIGWYAGKGKGSQRKQELLSTEGVIIHDGAVVDFEERRFSDFKIRPVIGEMRCLQERLSEKVVEDGSVENFRKVVGVDVSYEGDIAYSAAVIVDLSSGDVETRLGRQKVGFPYIPTYLSFRELPALIGLLNDLEDALVFVDGQGRLHQRGFGIACHLGLRTGLPTIGAAKSLLTGCVDEEGDIFLNDRRVGKQMELGGRKYYVSVGHMMSLDSAIEMSKAHLNDPRRDVLRKAHVKANKSRLGVA